MLYICVVKQSINNQLKPKVMRNTAFDRYGNAIFAIHHNKKKNTLRVTMYNGNRTLVKVSNPSKDEVEYFIDGTPSDIDVRNTFLR